MDLLTSLDDIVLIVYSEQCCLPSVTALYAFRTSALQFRHQKHLQVLNGNHPTTVTCIKQLYSPESSCLLLYCLLSCSASNLH